MYPEGKWSTDQSRSEVGAEHPRSRDELVQQLFKTEVFLWPSWVKPHRPWLLNSQLRSRACDACRRQLGRLDRSAVRTATRIRDFANGSSNRQSTCDFPLFKDAGFRTHRLAGHLWRAMPEIPSCATRGPSIKPSPKAHELLMQLASIPTKVSGDALGFGILE